MYFLLIFIFTKKKNIPPYDKYIFYLYLFIGYHFIKRTQKKIYACFSMKLVKKILQYPYKTFTSGLQRKA